MSIGASEHDVYELSMVYCRRTHRLKFETG